VYDLGTLALHNAAHDVDSSVMAIEQRSGGNDTNFIYRSITHKQQALNAANLAVKS
jgi:hypothetical protein